MPPPVPIALDGDLSRFQIGMSTSFSHQVENCWHHSGFISLVPDWNFLNLQSQCKLIMSILFSQNLFIWNKLVNYSYLAEKWTSGLFSSFTWPWYIFFSPPIWSNWNSLIRNLMCFWASAKYLILGCQGYFLRLCPKCVGLVLIHSLRYKKCISPIDFWAKLGIT